jgi:Tn3 transposase DDE domain
MSCWKGKRQKSILTGTNGRSSVRISLASLYWALRPTSTLALITSANASPRLLRARRGVTYYNLTSNQFTGLNAITVPGTLRDSLVLLAVVLEQQTELQPTQIMTEPVPIATLSLGCWE